MRQVDLSKRIASLSPEKRKLLEARLAQEGLSASRPAGGGAGTSAGLRPLEKMDAYPVSAGQKRLLLIQEIGDTAAAYNMPFVLLARGPVHVGKIQGAFEALISRHETLRTSFRKRDGEYDQIIHGPDEILFKLDYSEETVSSVEEERNVIERCVSSFIRPFDVSRAPLFRAALIRLAPERHLLMTDMHHTVSDGLSLQILAEEFNRLYRGEILPELPVHYKEYAYWQQERMRDGVFLKQEKYWLDVFEGEIPVLNMPADFPRPQLQSFEGGRCEFETDRGLADKLRRLASETGSTLYMVLLAAYYVLLHKYTDQEDIVIGTPVGGRTHTQLQPLIGMFVNTLAIRQAPAGSKTFLSFLNEIKEGTLGAFDHEEYPLESLLEKLGLRRDVSRNPLFDTVFSLQTKGSQSMEMEGLLLEPYEAQSGVSKFDLSLLAEEDEELTFTFEYATKLYAKQTVERLAGHYIQILREIAENRSLMLSQIGMLSAEERRLLLEELNETAAPYSRTSTIHGLFEEQVEKHPDRIAVSFEDRRYTYYELNARSNRLAAAMQDLGVGPDTIVAIMPERSPEMVIGILAILKAGGAYLPVDPEYPQERISYMLEDSGTRILLTHRHLAGSTEFTGHTVFMEDEQWYTGVETNPHVSVTSDHLAYVIYTSGTTGKPKGVMIEHRGMANMKLFYENTLGLGPEDRIVQFASFSFDASVWEMYMALFMGGGLYLAPKEKLVQLDSFEAFVRDNGITLAMLPPTFAVYLDPGRLPSLRILITGGSESSPELVRRWSPHVDYFNAYGPTEATICATVWEAKRGTAVQNHRMIPIGKPLYNTQVYLVNADLQLVPRGTAGELCIGGEALSRGYLHREALTGEKFVPNPFDPGRKMYRTGDLARWLPDGNLEYLGRIDHQVKIRGYRIELGEIETRLLQHGGVRETIVLVHEISSEKTLCAYYTSEGESPAASELREHMASGLPSYMVPAHFIPLKEFPLTPNGKIDRKALQAPDPSSGASDEYTAPETETEVRLVSLWQEVLGAERVSLHDNFFERGGHSLKAALLLAKISKEFGVELPLRKVFEAQTLQAQADAITAKGRTEAAYAPISKATEKPWYPVSPAQHRLLVVQEISGAATAYNVPLILEVKGALNPEKVNETFRKLIARHEALRTSFTRIQEEYVQVIHDPAQISFQVEVTELADLSTDWTDDQNEAHIKTIADGFIRPFDLGTAPLLRASLVKTEVERHLLLIDMHHLITDGTSLERMTEEFTRLYRGEELEELSVQYKDYTLWQNQLSADGTVARQEKFWLDTFSGEIPVLNFPLDYARPQLQSFEGAVYGFEADHDLTRRLQQAASRQGATLYMILLAAYNALLAQYSGQDDLIIGTPVAGRPHADLEDVLGMFVNTLPLRNYPSGSKTFAAFLDEVKQNALQAFENQLVPLEDLILKLQLRRDVSRNPLFDTVFVLQNTESREPGADGVEFAAVEHHNGISKFDLTLTAQETESTEGPLLSLSFEYATKLYKEDTIRKFADHYVQLLKQISQNPDMKLSDIDLLTVSERDLILEQFNATKTEYPRDAAVHELFEEQAALRPDEAAVLFGDKEITYAELNRKANQLAWKLHEIGVAKDTLVGIMAERSPEMIVAILAILKAGGAFLPIDPSYPEDRIAYMLDDSSAAVMLAGDPNSAQSLLGSFKGTVLSLADPSVYTGSESNLPRTANAESLAYVMYTSGSTGRPKGVMIEHRSVVRLVKNTNFVTFGPSDRILLTGALVFDACTFEIWGALLNGLQLCIVPESVFLHAGKLEEALQAYGITTMWLTSPLFNQLALTNPALFAPLRYLLVGGDVLSPTMIASVRNSCPQLTVINGYGPTENTTFSCCFPIDREYGNIPIGRPIANSTAYVVDLSGRLLPVGLQGEICVGGDGLARGYLNREDLNREKFVPNPFRPGERMYRTGDLGRWLPDGSIEYLGRMDQQVKIRGYRIEPGEIETRLLGHESVREAFVAVKESGEGLKFLCAYIGTSDFLTPSEVKAYLSGRIPDYMIPARFVFLPSLPLTKNGKIDRRALPEPEQDGLSSSPYAPPRSAKERLLAGVWESVLGVERVGIDDNFFELGGHSLKAIQLISKAQELGLEIGMHQLFQVQTIRGLSELLPAFKEAEEAGSESPGKHSDHVRDNAVTKIFEEAEQLLRDTFGPGFGLKADMREDKKVVILQLFSDHEKRLPEITQFIRSNFHKDLHPHFIEPQLVSEEGDEEKVAAAEIGQALQAEALNLTESDLQDTLMRVLKKVSSAHEAWGTALTQMPAAEQYSLAPIQEYHLAYPEASGTILSFDEIIDTQRLNAALQRVIEKHDLLRSQLVQTGEQWGWELKEKSPGFALPVVDLSAYLPSVQQRIMSGLLKELYLRPYELGGSAALYRFALISLNLREHILLLPCSHIIFDGMSSEILRSDVLAYYNADEDQSSRHEGNRPDHSYRSYVGQVRQGPAGIGDAEINERFRLESFYQQTSVIGEALQGKKRSKATKYRHEINMEGQDAGTDLAERMWEKALDLAERFFSRYVGLEEVPVWLTNYGRHYTGRHYYDTIGEFIDQIPVLLGGISGDEKRSVQNLLQAASTHNLNFFNLIYNRETAEDYPLSGYYLQNSLHKLPIVVNYLGETQQDGELLQELDDPDIDSTEVRPVIYFTVQHTGNLLHISLLLPYEEDEETIRRMFESVIPTFQTIKL
ncbi:non-ribosomal peptide synthetase [Paenibacillus chitinolyticus]|uniref:Non-ribosomal peptide synthetase n=1 Tax=Paenibacillus chitinolyticus TaxID=79263 RepID=A0A410WWU4_9BACL|nr:non-ribosomal peptide synthetase [Paenibacillus chitinolyticus]